MRKINLGVIGFGGRGGHVASQGMKMTDGMLDIVAAVETDKGIYEQSCSEYGVRPRLYASVEDMLKGERLDAALIGTPNQFHLENLKAFEGMSIPIFMEKPLDSTFERICEVVRFSERYKGSIMVGHCMRYAPILAKAKNMLVSGAIGKICSARFVQNCHYGNGGYHNWRRSKGKSGTWFLEKATHDLDIMNWLLEAKPAKVMAIAKLQAFGGDKPNDLKCAECDEQMSCPESMRNIFYRNESHIVDEMKGRDVNALCAYAKEVDTPDNEICLLHFDNGLFGSYAENFFSPRSYHHRIYEITGTLGMMEIDLGEYNGKLMVAHRFGNPNDREEHKFDYLMRNHYNGDGEMVKHFYQVAIGKERPHTTVKQAFMAELGGHAAVVSAERDEYISTKSLVPADLQNVFQEKLF